LDTDILVLDKHTLKDLEIFGSNSTDTSLFKFCNLTRSDGGADVLYRRMQKPWSSAERIQNTQAAITYIMRHRACFAKMPSAYAMDRTHAYLHEVMPVIMDRNPIEFGFSALSLRTNHDRYYYKIITGVQITNGLIRTAKAFVNQPTLTSAVGEIAPYINEMREILDRPHLKKLVDDDVGGWFWKILRLDQMFRLDEKVSINRILKLVFEIDALIAMADVTSQNKFVMPDLQEGPLAINAESLVHPFVPSPVPNAVTLDQNQRVLFLTGPNMAAKTTYLRAIATALYFAHLGMGVPASSFKFTPAQHLFSSISLSDDLHNGVSYFRAEALRAKAVAQAIADGNRVIALLDEPFKGTNVKDALDASLAILERFSTKQDCLFIFSSHLIELSDELTVTQQIDCRYFEADESTETLGFDYLLRSGVSSQRLGMRVLQEEGVFELLDSEKPKTQNSS
jgi:DNA mismatch repair ATPase MutS